MYYLTHRKAIMKATKYLDFDSNGIFCPTCKKPAVYVGCQKHEHKFPVVTKKYRYIRVPYCNRCVIDCSICGKAVNTIRFSDILEIEAIKEKDSKEKDLSETTIIKTDIRDILDQIDLSHIQNVSFFRNAVTSALDIIFSFDMGTQLGMMDTTKKLNELNLDIPINFSEISNTNHRLSLLFYTLMLIRSVGLIEYEQEIMVSEIDRIYKGRDDSKLLSTLKQILAKKGGSK